MLQAGHQWSQCLRSTTRPQEKSRSGDWGTSCSRTFRLVTYDNLLGMLHHFSRLSLSLLIQCIKFHRVIKSAFWLDHPHIISSYLHPIFIHPVAGMTRNQATRKLLYWPWDVRQMLPLSDCRRRLISPKIAMDLLRNCWIRSYCHTVHGQNPAPVGMVQTPWFIGYLLSQLFGFCFRWSWKVAKKCFWRWNSMLRLVISGNSV